MASKPSRACSLCGDRSNPVMGTLGICRACVVDRPADSAPRIDEAHAGSRDLHALPRRPPSSRPGAPCRVCARGCRMSVGERGFCNLREGATARSGAVRIRQLAGSPSRGLLHAYDDPLPTNCVADWVCDGHHQRGLHNLAVFYVSCTFDCLFCQNWHFREVDPEAAATVSAEELAERASRQTYCVSFFGGDPASQMPHALASDLPCTSVRHAGNALEAAFDAGLSRVHIGNRHLLSLADA
jgi:pyruvate formate lyase activating enzyme